MGHNVYFPDMRDCALHFMNLMFWQYPQTGRRYGIKNKAAIVLQCKMNDNVITPLFLFSVVVFFKDMANFISFFFPSFILY